MSKATVDKAAEEFVRASLSLDKSKPVAQLYEKGRMAPNHLSRSAIRHAVWDLVSRGEVTIDHQMKLRTRGEKNGR